MYVCMYVRTTSLGARSLRTCPSPTRHRGRGSGRAPPVYACVRGCMHAQRARVWPGSTCICMCAWGHGYMRGCMHACMGACMGAWVHACLRGCMHVCMHVFMGACIRGRMLAWVNHACMCASMHACTCMCARACARARARAHGMHDMCMCMCTPPRVRRR